MSRSSTASVPRFASALKSSRSIHRDDGAHALRPSLGRRQRHEWPLDRGARYVTTGRGESWLVDSSRSCARSWHIAVPGAATAVLAFMAGGYFPVTTGLSVAVLCLLLVAHVTLSERPFAGWSLALAVMAGALALFAVWAMLSGGWSDAPARALVEFDRALLVPADAGVHRAARARPGAIWRRCCAGWRWRSRRRAPSRC